MEPSEPASVQAVEATAPGLDPGVSSPFRFCPVPKDESNLFDFTGTVVGVFQAYGVDLRLRFDFLDGCQLPRARWGEKSALLPV